MPEQKEIAVIGGGCFWCTEAVFKMLRGVSSVLPGYAGGDTPNPTYDEIARGMTNHAEVIKIEYDPALVKYTDLLTVFFGSHDPTTPNRQGHDVGTQYRSIILYTTDKQKVEVEKFISDINSSNKMGAPIVTEVKQLDVFYDAENYHKDYYANNSGNMYCELVINPKLEKVQKDFAQLLNNNQTT